ncbi:MAG TPA: carboxy terminal-processing peptidase [Gammaproteobacteria bacterium]|nr:carboxy terminal-processing peptidase [Gammaproteobacteria bacterium]
MTHRFLHLLTGALLLLFGSVQAAIPSVAEQELVPQDKHERATEIITHIIGSYHYKNRELNDELSASILEQYLENLDPNRNYFLAGDIRQFSDYEDKLDDAIKRENLSPAFEIFKVYRQRVKERVDYARSLLQQDFSFDKNEEYRFDRREMPWAEDRVALNEIWRKRVKNDILNLRLAGKEKKEYTETLDKRYQRIKTSTFQLNANDVYQSFINAYTTSIEPHTAYFSPRISENFDISMRLSLEGIGAVLSNENDYTTIQRIIPGGPADLSDQLHAEDRIVGVGQGKNGEIVDVIGWRLDDVVDLIRGPKDTVLRLEIIPKNAGPHGVNRTITLTRNKIKLEEQAAQSSVIELEDSGARIGVIDVPTFYIDFAAQARGEKNYKSTSRDVRKLIGELGQKDIEGLVIDLRGNGGGSLSEALELTGLFIKEGPIVQTKDSTGKIEINGDPDPDIAYTGPLAVLVDRNSASASEIFAGAIQDYQRGIIIGEPTFGKGTVQNVVDLNRLNRGSDDDLGRLKTTIAQFFRISGGSNQFRGVIPDIIFPTFDEDSEYGERALENALPWDKVSPADYIKVSSEDNLEPLRNKHQSRIESDRSFKLLLEELELVQKNSDRKSISLLESERKQEREELLQAKRDLQNEFRVARGLEPLPEDADEEDLEVEEDEEVDILLNETARILHDWITSPSLSVDLQTVKQQDPAAINNNL